MSGYDNYSDVLGDDFDEDRRSDGKGLRSQLESVLAEVKNLREELGKEKRAKSVVTMLSEKGIDPKVAQLVPEGADPAEWLTEFGGLFGTAKGETLDAGDQKPQPGAQATPPPELQAEQAAMKQMQQGESAGESSTVNEDPIAKLNTFRQEGTEADLMKFLREGGMDQGSDGGVFR